MLKNKYMVKEQIKPKVKNEQSTSDENTLLLYNDDVNSFDFVIETLVDVCGHDTIQAEQCAMIAHYNGKCPIYTSSIDELLPLSSILSDKGLSVQIN